MYNDYTTQLKNDDEDEILLHFDIRCDAHQLDEGNTQSMGSFSLQNNILKTSGSSILAIIGKYMKE